VSDAYPEPLCFVLGRIPMTRPVLGRRAPVLVILALVLSALSPTAGNAATPRKFTFFGSGYGHGLGLPQWGAYGLALKGWSHQRILGHFYKGTTVATAPSIPSTLRIGLVHNTKTVHLSVVQGTVALRLGGTNGKLIGGRTIKQGETWRVLVAASGRYRVLNGAGKLVGGHLWGSPKVNLYAVYSSSGKVRVSESGHTYNRGYLEFNLYASKSCSQLSYCERLIIVLKPQSYLVGLSEVPSSWPLVALEVQAVAARTYAFEKVFRLGQHRSPCNCALYDDTSDQVYAGWDKEGAPQGARWVSSVRNTNGLVVLYNGAPIQAYYHSASGGFTENNEFVWGGTPLPYLRGVCDPGDYSNANPNTVWKVGPLSDATVTAKLRLNIGTVTTFANAVRGVSGRIVTITVVGTKGQRAISGTTLRRALALKDDRVWINANRHVTGQIRLRYDKLNCAPGLAASSQQSVPGGLRQRFADGAIYWNQVKTAAYWEHGPIYDKYRQLGESGGLLGMPQSDVTRLVAPGCSGDACAKARFDRGNVYFKDGIGDGAAHELHGYVLGHFIAAGEASGHLGFPITDVNLESDGSTWAKFEHGVTVQCSSSGNCVEVGGLADLSLRISDSPDPIGVGSRVTYTVSVRNAGPGRATAVVVNEDLPDSVTLVSAKPSQGSCQGSHPVTCTIGSVKRGATATVKLVVRTAKGGKIRDAGRVDAKEPDPRPGNDSRSVGTLVCTLLGTARNDVLRGTNGHDVICGLGGNDRIYGFGGNDDIYSGPGSDIVDAGSGADRIYGSYGADTAYGSWGTDFIFGGSGNDALIGGPGADTCSQGAGKGPRISCEL
jgi:SpoIID/LytB domain protein/uncharacterized repeat protein (TIGR01451 family)